MIGFAKRRSRLTVTIAEAIRASVSVFFPPDYGENKAFSG
jgi:hypothetical protein